MKTRTMMLIAGAIVALVVAFVFTTNLKPPEGQAGIPKLSAEKNLAIYTRDGKKIDLSRLKGKIVVVHFWATWCPPCRSTLEWLGEVKKKYGDNVAVLALAVESPEQQVRDTAASLSPEIRWAIAAPDTARAFGDIVAVPTMFLFDRSGKTVKVLYGAPPDLHQQAERAMEQLTKVPVGGQ